MELKYSIQWTVNVLTEHYKMVEKLTEMLCSDKLTHAEKRHIARTLQLLNREIPELIKPSDTSRDDLPF